MEKIFTRRFSPLIYAFYLFIILLSPVISIIMGKNYTGGYILAMGMLFNFILFHSMKTKITSNNKLTEGGFQTEIQRITRIKLSKYTIKLFYISQYSNKEAKRTFYLKDREGFIESLKQINPNIQIEQKN